MIENQVAFESELAKYGSRMSSAGDVGLCFSITTRRKRMSNFERGQKMRIEMGRNSIYIT